MKKTLAAAAAGLLLVAGQAAASGQTATARVGDRVGPQAGESSEFAGIPLIGLLAAAGVITAVVIVASDDDSEIMGLRHKELPIHGVQFHPESILTQDGKHLLKNFLEM